MIYTGVKKPPAKPFRSVAFWLAVEEAVHNCLSKPQSVESVATMMIDAPPLTVLMAKFVKGKVGKSYLDKAKMKERFIKLTKPVLENTIPIGDGI